MGLFNKKQEQIIVAAIKEAEKNTSAELKVHIDSKCKGEPLDEAAKWFARLKMGNTQARNGVLIYIAYKDRKIAVIGDKGINELVESDFWDSTYKIMRDKFVVGDYSGGLSDAIGNISGKLKHYFPSNSDDVNEINDDISYGS